MRRPPEIMLFIILVVSMAGAMNASGLSQDFGVQPETGIEDEVNDTQEVLQDRDYEANREKGEVNFIGSVFASVDKVVGAFVLVYELKAMMINVGLPGWLATFLASPIFLILGIFMLYMISGRRMTVR